MKALDGMQPCPCGRGVGTVGEPHAQTSQAGAKQTAKQRDPHRPVLPYADCCSRWLEGAAKPPDAETLMRSRYSAFVLERAAYLLQSWAPSHRPESIAFDAGVKWLGLDVRAHRITGEATAEVEFVARQKPLSGPAVRLHERSRFVLEAGQWLYVDGDQL